MTSRLLLVAAVAAGVLGFTPGARAADPEPTRYAIDANINDPAIETARGPNLVWLPPAAQRVGKLLVFIPFGGAANFPTNFEHFAREAGRLGYHTISLAYKNELPIANVNACGNEELPLSTSPPNCAINARMEILTGDSTLSPVVTVNRANSIENRLNKALAHLVTDSKYAGQGWAQFVEADGTPKWSQTVIAGGSLGAGFAALIASLHSVDRVAVFGGWTDAKHPVQVAGEPPRLWVRIGATPAEKYFSLIHFRDVFYPRTCGAYAVFAMPQTCPLTLPAELAENRRPPFGTRQLVFDLPRDPTAPEQQNGSHHPSVIRDNFIAKDTDGVSPSPVLVNFWRSTLGDSDADKVLDQADNCPLIVNTEQIDSDANGTGDACGPTRRDGGASGTVPATLALTLGPPATFGAFTPGVNRDYDASTTANVISTAGDAALSASPQPAYLTNGAFTLAEPLQVTFSKATWTGPVSNDAVTIAFRQHIGSTQALRTGAYSKTLTFTLSTTTP